MGEGVTLTRIGARRQQAVASRASSSGRGRACPKVDRRQRERLSLLIIGEGVGRRGEEREGEDEALHGCRCGLRRAGKIRAWLVTRAASAEVSLAIRFFLPGSDVL